MHLLAELLAPCAVKPNRSEEVEADGLEHSADRERMEWVRALMDSLFQAKGKSRAV